MLILAVAAAGAVGALARWGVGTLFSNWLGPRFPYGTLCVNLVGCFLIGVLSEIAARTQWLTPEVRITIAVGFIGTLTTFSSWEFETWSIARRGELAWAGANFIINCTLGFFLIWIGSRLVAAVVRG